MKPSRKRAQLLGVATGFGAGAVAVWLAAGAAPREQPADTVAAIAIANSDALTLTVISVSTPPFRRLSRPILTGRT
ncbi:hypothetical protein WR25_24849 [Diploscapter pachys]|uniref:Uncharacterized protein n=1 Tax=Diploscapter pachys TaxID=2018661 RepID=A0A2A2K6M1_9BILA|nr:hypothetical protein WR25_24849 [Diploscapter pachys]